MAATAEAQVGVIGGSGFSIEGMELQEVPVETRFESPSDVYKVGEIDGISVAFLARHGQDHQIPPHQIPNRANIEGFRRLGVERVISVCAVGSLVNEVAPQDFVVPDQLIDRSTRTPRTFFEDGIVAHVNFADPFCPDLRTKLIDAAREVVPNVHEFGTYLNMEGPQFSTRAESEMHRWFEATLVGMTAGLEAKLAREAGLCFAVLALSTDYDSWRVEEAGVDMTMIADNMQVNAERARKTLMKVVPTLVDVTDCECSDALEGAIVTPIEKVNPEVLERLEAIIGKHVGGIPISES